MRARLADELAMFVLAVQFLTRIPIPAGGAYTPERLAAAPRYFPLVGAGVGALCALLFWATQATLGTNVAVLIALSAGLLITGAFHEDGLADTFDGLGVSTKEKMLTVMRDSRIGTFGTAALVAVLALKAAALMTLPPLAVIYALVIAHGLSRLSAVLVIASSRYVREHGTGKPTADGIDTTALGIAVGTGALLLVLLALGTTAYAALYAAAGALAGHVLMRALFERRLGGYTGDTLGAVQQLSELGVYLGFLVWQ